MLRVVRELTGAADASLTAETPLMEAGVDSLAATELSSRLRDVSGMALSATLVFEQPTPRAIAAHLLEQLAGDELVDYETAEEICSDPNVDAVYIASPNRFHAEHTITAARHGKHVLIEKPMTRYLNEGFDVYDTCKRTKRVMQIGAVFCICLLYTSPSPRD